MIESFFLELAGDNSQLLLLSVGWMMGHNCFLARNHLCNTVIAKLEQLQPELKRRRELLESSLAKL